MITVYDFMDLCIGNFQIYKLYDISIDQIIWSGCIDDLPDEYANLEVTSFDELTGYSKEITLNINTEEGDYNV
jgi:hypothetical protein